MKSWVNFALKRNQILIACFLVVTAITGLYLLSMALQNDHGNENMVKAIPIDQSTLAKRGVVQEWVPSNAIFKKDRQTKQAATVSSKRKSAVDQGDGQVSKETADATETTKEETAASRTSPDKKPTRAAVADPNIITFSSFLPKKFLPEDVAQELSQWKSKPISVADVTKARRKIATGEKVYKRLDIRRPGPFDEVRAKTKP